MRNCKSRCLPENGFYFIAEQAKACYKKYMIKSIWYNMRDAHFNVIPCYFAGRCIFQSIINYRMCTGTVKACCNQKNNCQQNLKVIFFCHYELLILKAL